MNEPTKKAVDWLKRQIEWIDFSQKRYNKRISEEREYRNSHPVSVQQSKENLRAAVAKLVERGWRIEMQNEFDVILSKRQGFNWVFHLILILILVVIFAPLALFWLFVMVILAVTKRRSTKRVRVEKNGDVFER